MRPAELGCILLAMFFASGPAALARDLPVPPIPPEHASVGETAPVPNVDARAPAVPTSEAASVNVKLYREKLYDPSMGFTPGSRYQSSEDRKPIQTPGLSVSVPLK